MNDRRIVERLREWPLSEKLALEAAARIEALEMQIQEDTVRLDEDAAIMEKATARIAKQKARIEALEATLRRYQTVWPQDAIDQEMIEQTKDGWKLK